MVYTHQFRGAPFLFSDQFDSAGWLFMALADGNHRVLVAADLKNVKFDMYNSLGHDTDSV